MRTSDRLWDQVAANLTTLGEMAGVRYQVSPVEELQEKKKKKGKKLDPVGKEDEDIDNDGDVDDSDSYLKKRREAIGKAMKKEEVEVETELDERACWDSHKKVGMKMKGGKLVNDCRPKNESFNVNILHISCSATSLFRLIGIKSITNTFSDIQSRTSDTCYLTGNLSTFHNHW